MTIDLSIINDQLVVKISKLTLLKCECCILLYNIQISLVSFEVIWTPICCVIKITVMVQFADYNFDQYCLQLLYTVLHCPENNQCN